VKTDSIVTSEEPRIRVLYSFPHKIGADRICYTAWQQVKGLADAGADVLLFPGVLHRPVPKEVKVQPTLARGKLRIPYKLLGTLRACALHDYIVSRRIEKLAGKIDIVHTWPLGALRTLKSAAKLGIPTVLERPNAHTRFAYETVQKECERLGVSLPHDHEHAFNADVLAREEAEYQLTERLLCPSEFTAQTFRDRGFSSEHLLRHIYGYDEKLYYPSPAIRDPRRGLTMLFVGVCAVRKGVHYALAAWLSSPAHRTGTFLIAGEFLPAYAAKLAPMLSHPSVRVLGHRNDIPELMRQSDLLVLPTIEEGFGLVCVEAIGSGCVPVVSEACTDLCHHMENSLVHRMGDVKTLTDHITMLHEDRSLLKRLRSAGLAVASTMTWTAAGRRLLETYREAISSHQAAGGLAHKSADIAMNLPIAVRGSN
jgi:glycosyltransferase involved in cell wall biosynthesis